MIESDDEEEEDEGEEDHDSDNDIEIPDISQFNMSPNRNHNKNNQMDQDQYDDDEDEDDLDGLDKFDFDDDEDAKQNELIERDDKYKYSSYHEYLSRQVNDPNSDINKSSRSSIKKIEGDFRDDDWFKNPKDHKKRPHRIYKNKDDKVGKINPSANLSQIFVPEKAYKQMKNLRAQWWKLKSTHYDGILCFKKGNFYQLYYEDAYIGHRLCGFHAYPDETRAGKTGFPEQSFDKVAETFVKHGHKACFYCDF